MTVFERAGWCPACRRRTTFVSRHAWLRDHYCCAKCQSLPRERALYLALDRYFPGWIQGAVHEGSPSKGQARQKLVSYSASQFYADKPLGEQIGAFRNENLEKLTFADNALDFFITLDVLEHVFDPEKAVMEMYRCVRPGGAVVFTAPVYKDLAQTRQRTALKTDGTVEYLLEPVYHGNPVGDGRSLVTWDYGQDFGALLKSWTDGTVIHVNELHPEHGIEGEFLDVFLICREYEKSTFVTAHGSVHLDSQRRRGATLTKALSRVRSILNRRKLSGRTEH